MATKDLECSAQVMWTAFYYVFMMFFAFFGDEPHLFLLYGQELL